MVQRFKEVCGAQATGEFQGVAEAVSSFAKADAKVAAAFDEAVAASGAKQLLTPQGAAAVIGAHPELSHCINFHCAGVWQQFLNNKGTQTEPSLDLVKSHVFQQVG